jgi:hypothetical protein
MMSRLDSLIRRLRAQRICLTHAATVVRDLPGPIVELGFGNGRTYDHLRELFPGREIFVFERQAPEESDGAPDGRHLILGDIRATLPAAGPRFAAGVPLIHSDLGSGDTAENGRLATFLAARLPELLAPGGLVVSDLALPGRRSWALPLPPTVPRRRYFLYRRDAADVAGRADAMAGT